MTHVTILGLATSGAEKRTRTWPVTSWGLRQQIAHNIAISYDLMLGYHDDPSTKNQIAGSGSGTVVEYAPRLIQRSAKCITASHVHENDSYRKLGG